MATVTATFDSDADLQQAIDALAALGIEGDAVRVIAPPPPEAEVDAADRPAPDEEPVAGAALIAGAAVAGMAGLGLAASGSPGAAAAMGYPAGGVLAGVAAGALLSEAYGRVADLSLSHEDADLYRQRLRDGATLLSVHAPGDLAEEVAETLRRHHAADLRGA